MILLEFKEFNAYLTDKSTLKHDPQLFQLNGRGKF